MTVTVRKLTGAEIAASIEAIADLRIRVFADFPYLYDGSRDYEARYLAEYVAAPDAVLVGAFAGEAMVGAATAASMIHQKAEFRAPFEARGIDTARLFYFGESVLLSAWRGRGIGHAFFDHREAHARALGRFAWTAFCAVDRADDDPRKPVDHRGNEVFWGKRGYERRPGMTMRLPWDEIGQGETDHALTFWLRPLEVAR